MLCAGAAVERTGSRLMRRPGRKTAVFRRSASGGLPLGRPSGHRGGILPQNRDRPEPMSAGVARGVVPTIRPMLENLQQLAASAFMQRATLWLNHVLSSEEAAVQRLRPHAGRFIRLQMEGWPALLPPLPELSFAITPAGLVEWCGSQAPAAVDLRLTIDASNPARTLAQGLAGHRPAVEVVGDA